MYRTFSLCASGSDKVSADGAQVGRRTGRARHIPSETVFHNVSSGTRRALLGLRLIIKKPQTSYDKYKYIFVEINGVFL